MAGDGGQTKIHAREGDWKKIVQRSSEGKNISAE